MIVKICPSYGYHNQILSMGKLLLFLVVITVAFFLCNNRDNDKLQNLCT